VFFEKAYFLGPAAGGGKTYKLLAEAMRKEHRVALARWVSGNREHLVIIRPFHNGLVLHTMYYADEVRDFGAIEIEDAPVKEKEVKLAEMLIDELTEKKFNPMQYKDEYRQRLLERINAKSQGQAIVSDEREEEETGEVIDIMEALRRSLEGSGRAPAGRAPAKASRGATMTKRRTTTPPARTTSRKRRAS
jgi:DNA end-binding protein Ku